MRKLILGTVLVGVLAALVCDVILRPVHAQIPLTVYIDSAPHHFEKERHDVLTLKGTEVIGVQCADGSCCVLNK